MQGRLSEGSGSAEFMFPAAMDLLAEGGRDPSMLVDVTLRPWGAANMRLDFAPPGTHCVYLVGVQARTWGCVCFAAGASLLG